MRKLLVLFILIAFISCSKEENVTVKYLVPKAVNGPQAINVTFATSGFENSIDVMDGWEHEFIGPKDRRYYMQVTRPSAAPLRIELYIDGVLVDHDETQAGDTRLLSVSS